MRPVAFKSAILSILTFRMSRPRLIQAIRLRRPLSVVTTASGAFGANSGLTFNTLWESIPGGNQDAIIRYAVQAISGTINEVGLAFNGAAPFPSTGTFATVTKRFRHSLRRPTHFRRERRSEL